MLIKFLCSTFYMDPESTTNSSLFFFYYFKSKLWRWKYLGTLLFQQPCFISFVLLMHSCLMHFWQDFKDGLRELLKVKVPKKEMSDYAFWFVNSNVVWSLVESDWLTACQKNTTPATAAANYFVRDKILLSVTIFKVWSSSVYQDPGWTVLRSSDL